MNATPSGFSSLQTHFIFRISTPFRLISYWTRLPIDWSRQRIYTVRPFGFRLVSVFARNAVFFYTIIKPASDGPGVVRVPASVSVQPVKVEEP